MKKKSLLFSILAAGALVTLASCGNEDELNKQIEELKSEITSLKQENSGLKNDKDALTQDNKKLSDEKTAEIAAKQEALSQVDALTNDKTSLTDSYNSLKNEYENTIDLYEALKSDNEEIWNDFSTVLKNNNSYAIKVVDPAGKSRIGVYDIGTGLTDALRNDYNAVIENGYYGLSIKSINNFSDPNWYAAIYENGEYSQVGIGDLQVDKGDFFVFKYECWNTVESGYGTLDEYDVLVDKAIYNYYVNVLPTKLSTVTTYTGSTYWDSLALYKLKNTQLYGANAYSYESTVNNPFSYDYVTALNNVNQSELSGNNLFKYYYADRLVANNRNYDALKTKYQSYLDTLTSYSAWGEYANPFHTGAAKSLGLTVNDAIKNTEYRADTTYGTDGLAWELAGLACYNALTTADLSGLSFEALENNAAKDVSLSAYILPYAASNINFRELKTVDGIDALRVLFSYYDESTMQFSTEKLSNDMSSNQIYAALVAYKIQRDTNNAQNLFE